MGEPANPLERGGPKEPWRRARSVASDEHTRNYWLAHQLVGRVYMQRMRSKRFLSAVCACALSAGAASADENGPLLSVAGGTATAGAPRGDAITPTAQIGAAARFKSLEDRNPRPDTLRRGIGRMTHCMLGYTAPAELTHSTPAPMSADGGIFYTEAERALWRERIESGPFVSDGDFRPGSPGDWDRIAANTRAMVIRGEAAWKSDTPSEERAVHGTRARDAAFFYLLTGNETVLAAVRLYLVEQSRNPLNDFTRTLCIREPDGVILDGRAHASSWLLRYAVTYDFVRGGLSPEDRVSIEQLLSRNAYFLAAQLDFGLNQVFPNRQRGDYGVRLSNADPARPEATWWRKRFDTDGDCKAGDFDVQAPQFAYAYVRGDGVRGPRLSVLSQYYNNRRSTDAVAVGAVGVVLADGELIANGKRYFMEWLTYGVLPDGSQGEYARNGDYCIPGQGLIYSQSNIQGAILLARALARQGDASLATFSTRAGLFGTESSTTAKSIDLAAGTYVKIRSGELAWYYDEPWKSEPDPRAATALQTNVVHYMNSPRAMDGYHELGMLPYMAFKPLAPIDQLVLRDPAATSLRFPGSTGNPVPTGFGAWTDVFNAMPAMLFIRP